MEYRNVNPDEVKKSLEKAFRDSVAPTWYELGFRFADPNLNRHCRGILRKDGYSIKP